MSGSRIALIIGNDEYSDHNLSNLVSPSQDAKALSELLRDPNIGMFDEVLTLVNEVNEIVRREITKLFSRRKPDDLLLLYFSGHGVQDERGRLYLTLQDTETSLLRATAIPANFVSEEMDYSRSKRQVLILDCCYSGAFSKGAKAAIGVNVGTGTAFEGNGFGRVILTATDAIQFAQEGDNIIGQPSTSMFTSHLIEGIKTGGAGLGKEWITIDSVYDYVYKKVLQTTNSQTPCKWVFGQEGEIYLARNSNVRVKSAEPSTHLQQKNPIVRGIVSEGEKLIGESHNISMVIRGIESATQKAISIIKTLSIPVTSEKHKIDLLETVIHNPKLSRAIIQSREMIGDGTIYVKGGQSDNPEVEFINGFRFDHGYISPYFVTNPETSEALIENAYVLLYPYEITTASSLEPIINKMLGVNFRNLVVIAKNISADALAPLISNKLRGMLNVVAIKTLGSEDYCKTLLQDIAIMTGGQILLKELGRSLDTDVTIADLGRARQVISLAEETTMIDHAYNQSDNKAIVNGYIAKLQGDSKRNFDEGQKLDLSKRLARLAGKLAIIRVKVKNEAELIKIRQQVGESLALLLLAEKGGIVPSNGLCLFNVAYELTKIDTKLNYDRLGLDIVRKGFEAPLSHYVASMLKKDPEFLEKIRRLQQKNNNKNICYDLYEEKFCDFVEVGAIEPTMKVCDFVEHSVQEAIKELIAE